MTKKFNLLSLRKKYFLPRTPSLSDTKSIMKYVIELCLLLNCYKQKKLRGRNLGSSVEFNYKINQGNM